MFEEQDGKTIKFIEKAKNIHGNKYDYSKVIYTHSFNPVEIICPVHGSFFQKPSNHLIGSNCPKCSRINQKSKLSLSHIEIIEQFKKVHGEKYNYSKVIYKNANTEVEIICPIHGSFFQKPMHHKAGSNCPKCLGKAFLTPSERIERWKKLHNNKYDYSKVIYTRMVDPVEIICPIHGSFFQKPAEHGNGNGCQLCAKDKAFLDTETTIEQFKKVHGNLYDYSKVIYTRTVDPVEIICPVHGSFFQTPMGHKAGAGCSKCNTSKGEKELINLYQNFEHRNRTLLYPFEIDLVNHEKKFGIEFNGLLWHSCGIRFPNNLDIFDKNKHSIKTNLMEAIGYQLFHINDLDWNHPIKKEIWKSMINSKLGKTYRIFARKLKIIDLSKNNNFVNDFMDKFHLQGSRPFSYAYGLYNEKNEVYCIMTFGRPAFDSKAEWEIYRFATILNYTIIGGASKLLKQFERIHKPKSLLSYAKRDWSLGNVYEKLNFKFSHNTEPSIFWFDPKNGILYPRLKFQKHKLKNIENFIFNETLTADENMYQNGYRKYFDSGNKVYYKNYEELE